MGRYYTKHIYYSYCILFDKFNLFTKLICSEQTPIKITPL